MYAFQAIQLKLEIFLKVQKPPTMSSINKTKSQFLESVIKITLIKIDDLNLNLCEIMPTFVGITSVISTYDKGITPHDAKNTSDEKLAIGIQSQYSKL